MSNVVDIARFRLGDKPDASAYEKFCAARQVFLRAYISLLESSDLDIEVIRDEIKTTISALNSVPVCLGKTQEGIVDV